MKTSFKLFFGLGILLLFFTQPIDAQILQDRNEIVEAFGTPTHSGVSKSGENYLYYKIPVKTSKSGTYHQRRIFFFKTAEDGSETCYKWKILEPSTETVANISSFTRNLVQVGERQWKDYGKGIIYQVDEKKEFCLITAWYDNEVELAKVYKM